MPSEAKRLSCQALYDVAVYEMVIIPCIRFLRLGYVAEVDWPERMRQLEVLAMAAISILATAFIHRNLAQFKA